MADMKEAIRGEVTAELAEKHVRAVLEQRRRTRFDGEVSVKYEFRGGVLARVHVDNHDVIDAETALKQAIK